MPDIEKYNGPTPDALSPRGAEIRLHARNLNLPGSQARLIVFKDQDGYLQGDGEKALLVVPVLQKASRVSIDGLLDSLLLDALAAKFPGAEKIANRGYEMLAIKSDALDYALKIFASHRDRVLEAPIARQYGDGKVNFDTRLLAEIFSGVKR